MKNNIFSEDFLKFAKEHNLTEEELLKYVFSFSERKKQDYSEEKKQRRRNRIMALDFRKKMLLSDLDVSMKILDNIKKPIDR